MDNKQKTSSIRYCVSKAMTYLFPQKYMQFLCFLLSGTNLDQLPARYDMIHSVIELLGV